MFGVGGVERRVGEVDGAVGADDEVVGGGEVFALEVVGEDGDGAVFFGAGDALGGLFAGDEAALRIAGVSVGGVGGGAEFDEAGGGGPFPHILTVGVGKDEIAVIAAEPDGAFRPGEAGAEFFPFGGGIDEIGGGGLGGGGHWSGAGGGGGSLGVSE